MDNNFPTFDDVSPSRVVLNIDDLVTIDAPETPETPTEVETPETVDTPETPETDPLAQAAYEVFVEKGIFEQVEGFDGTFESFESQIEELPNKLLRKAVDELPEHSQQVLKFVVAAGTNLQKDEFEQFIREFITEQNAPEVTSIDEARVFMENHLKSQGLRPAAIQAQLDDLEDTNELLSEAEKLLKSREKKTDTLIQEKEAENKAIADSHKEFFANVQKEISETKWSKPQQDKVLKTIPKANEILQSSVANPKAYIQLVDFLSTFNGKEFSLEAIERRGESKATSLIKEKLEKSGYSSASKTQVSTETPNTGGGGFSSLGGKLIV